MSLLSPSLTHEQSPGWIGPLRCFGSRQGARQDVCAVSRLPQLILKWGPGLEPGTVGAGRSGLSSGAETGCWGAEPAGEMQAALPTQLA